MKKVTKVFDGREALPVRAVPLVTAWYVTPQALTLELSEDKSVRRLTAYRYSDGQAIPIKADAWGMKNDVLNDIVQADKGNELEANQHRQSAWRKSLEGLPAGVFVWLDEFEAWYSHAYVAPDSVWEEEHRNVGEDDDPEPQFHPKRHDALDLFPISLDEYEPLIREGFETETLPVLSAPSSANDSERQTKLNEMLERLNDPAYLRDLEIVEVESGRLEKARERYAKWDEIGDGGTSVGLDLKETRLGDAKKELDELEEKHKVMRGDIFPELQAVREESAEAEALPIVVGLLTKDIAEAFDSLNGWTAERWRKNLSSSQWLHTARTGRGAQGGVSAFWNPLLLAQLIHGQEKDKNAKGKLLNTLNSRFTRIAALAPWRDDFNEYSATFWPVD